MNADEDRNIENLLTDAGRVLKEFEGNLVDPPPRVTEAIDRALKEQTHVWKELPAAEMKELLLTILRQQPMEGIELTRRLEAVNIKLKDGEGAIYGMPSDLESVGLLESWWEEGRDRMKKLYRPTEEGVAFLQKADKRAGRLNVWAQAVLTLIRSWYWQTTCIVPGYHAGFPETRP